MMNRTLYSIIGFLLLSAISANAQIVLPGKTTYDKFLAAFWNQNSNASNAVAGINAYSEIPWDNEMLPLVLSNQTFNGTFTFTNNPAIQFYDIGSSAYRTFSFDITNGLPKTSNTVARFSNLPSWTNTAAAWRAGLALSENSTNANIATAAGTGGYIARFITTNSVYNADMYSVSNYFGIGLTNPATKLHIRGASGSSGITLDPGGIYTAYQLIVTTQAADEGLAITMGGTPILSTYGYTDANSLGIGTAGNSNLVYLNGSNVGIGTMSSSAKLAVNGGLHVGGTSDPGDNNMAVDGNVYTAGTDHSALAVVTNSLTSGISYSGSYIATTNVSSRTGTFTNTLNTGTLTASTNITVTAGVWEDLQVPGYAFKSGPTTPTFGDFGGTTNLMAYLFGAAVNEGVYFTCQLPHGYKEGSEIRPHIHWTKSASGSGTNVVWELSYDWKNMNAAYSAATTVTITNTVSGTNWFHQLSSFPAIDGTGKTISSIVNFRLRRLGTVTADDYDQNAAMLQFDLHYLRDSLGSVNETSK